jgi:hypothetical protein
MTNTPTAAPNVLVGSGIRIGNDDTKSKAPTVAIGILIALIVLYGAFLGITKFRNRDNTVRSSTILENTMAPGAQAHQFDTDSYEPNPEGKEGKPYLELDALEVSEL